MPSLSTLMPGPVSVTVSNLETVTQFYVSAIGLQVLEQDGPITRLGVGTRELLTLHHDPAAQRIAHAPGLFHIALLVPSRAALAAALAHLIEAAVPLQGAADHLVSESIYLADPEGNGIEIYRDRPREQWRFVNGTLHMSTDPLAVRDLMRERDSTVTWTGLPEGTVMGHVHLRVSDINASERFYRDVIGLDVTTRYGEAASFLSAGGYHHHLGVNTWNSLKAPSAIEGSLGLRAFTLQLPTAADVDALADRLTEAGIDFAREGDALRTTDPSGNAVVFRC